MIIIVNKTNVIVKLEIIVLWMDYVIYQGIIYLKENVKD